MSLFKHHTLGNSNLTVPEICLGTMTFGEQTDEADAHARRHAPLQRIAPVQGRLWRPHRAAQRLVGLSAESGGLPRHTECRGCVQRTWGMKGTVQRVTAIRGAP